MMDMTTIAREMVISMMLTETVILEPMRVEMTVMTIGTTPIQESEVL